MQSGGAQEAGPPGSRAPGPTEPVAFPTVGRQAPAAARGVTAGLVGAGGFTLFCMAAFALAGRGVWQPVNLVAYTFWSGAAQDGGFHLPSLLLGLSVLAVAGILMGVPLALLFHNIEPHWALVLPLAVVIPNMLWVVGHGLIWPAVNPEAARLFSPLLSWIGHGVYGLVFGLALLAMKRRADLRGD